MDAEVCTEPFNGLTHLVGSVDRNCVTLVLGLIKYANVVVVCLLLCTTVLRIAAGLILESLVGTFKDAFRHTCPRCWFILLIDVELHS